jgi:hypothetical protein
LLRVVIYRITSQRSSWYLAEITTVLPIAEGEIIPWTYEEYLEFLSVFKFLSLFVQLFLVKLPKMFCGGARFGKK